MTLSTLVTLALASAPITLPVQGQLLDPTGAPIEGTHALTLTLRAGSATLATGVTTVEVHAGNFTAELLVDPDDLATAGALTVAVRIDDAPESAEVQVGWTPRAAWASNAGSVGGVGPDALVQWSHIGEGLLGDGATLSLDPDWVADAANAVDDDTLGGLTCADGDVPTWSATSGAFVCAQAPFRTASQVVAAVVGATLSSLNVSGLIGAGSLNVTGTATTGALTVSGAATTGALTAASLSTGAASTGALTATSVTASGAIKLGAVPDNACTTGAAGTLRYNSTRNTLELCNGSAWVAFRPATDGSTSASPGSSCKQLKTDGFSVGNAAYWIDPNGGSSSDAYQVWCDMVTEGGPSWA
jgi:hypothetical protein